MQRTFLPSLLAGCLLLSPACIWTTTPPDLDGDGYGSDVDCDDADPMRHPGMQERCNDIDDDCDGLFDEEPIDARTWFFDADGDGYGDRKARTEACEAPQGYVDDDSDCDDRCAACAPDQVETCDGLDNDCDDLVDEDGATGGQVVYADADLDGYGDPDTARTACTPRDEEVADGTDCDDGDEAINPGAVDYCGDGLDHDCDGETLDCRILVEHAAATISADSFKDGLGTAVLGPGDLDGDGHAELLLSAPYSDDLGASAGEVFLFYGPLSGELGPHDADRAWGGPASYDQLGEALAVLGDQDGDGQEELVLAAPRASRSLSGDGWVCIQRLRGSSSTACEYAVAEVRGAHTAELAGVAVSGGDLDGDGIDDLAIGSPGDPSGGEDTGAVHLFYGPLEGSLDTSEADLSLLGTTGSHAGSALAFAGDTDGDGAAELLVGGPSWNESRGRAWVVGSEAQGERTLDEAARARVNGPSAGVQLGAAVSGAGDLDGDGTAEVALGAWLVSSGDKEHTGAVYVFRSDELSGAVSPGTAWATVTSQRPHSYLGSALAPGGDFDGSGSPDLLLGAFLDPALGEGAGSVALVLDLSAGELDISVATPSIVGEESLDGSGASVTGLGDMDGDGLDDVAVGSPWGADNQGTVTVIHGRSTW